MVRSRLAQEGAVRVCLQHLPADGGHPRFSRSIAKWLFPIPAGAPTPKAWGSPEGGGWGRRRGSTGLAPTHGLEAIQAVHRPRPCGHERHLGRLAAVRADHVVHHPRAAVPIGLPPSGAAFRATARLVLKPTRLIELLLPRRE